jgi:hypothetical protein
LDFEIVVRGLYKGMGVLLEMSALIIGFYFLDLVMRKNIQYTDIVVYQGVIASYSIVRALAEINKDKTPEIRKATAKELHQYSNRP